eukprot:TRINITY_DN20983_c0_g3_i1.p2 TRINITY_DN20983_c0_g3~~TRINITY_DN20983_c0_g3_i1.p2  ORF type:complete len:303 (+),score=58.13 TRINITY_DN20983_c0_g3_i1:233-1141(+)
MMDPFMTMAIIHIISTSLLAISIGIFIFHEIRFGEKIFSNPFVVLTLFTTVTMLGYCVVFLMSFYSSYGLSSLLGFSTLQRFKIAYGMLFVFVSMGHMGLLFLRTQAVFVTSMRFVKVMRVLLLLFFLLSATVIGVFIGFCFSPDPNSSSFKHLKIAYDLVTPLSVGVLSTIDITTTVAFATVVRDVYKNRGFSNRNMHKQAVNTELIAKRGVVISLTSTLGFMFFVAGFFVSDIEQHEWLVLVSTCLASLVGILWISMKIELDWNRRRVSGNQILKELSKKLSSSHEDTAATKVSKVTTEP